MNGEDLVFFREWFGGYCKEHHRDAANEQMNIALKEKHSLNVAANALLIAEGEALGGNGRLLAETAGLLHDVGRFPQYAKYSTFRDADSVNHGVLGAEVLEQKGVLDRLPEKERAVIIRAVRFHNAFAIPEGENDDVRLYLKLVRDADKLDIWRVFSNYCEGGEEAGADAVALGLPDAPEYSDEAVRMIMDREIVRLGRVKTLNDIKLLQLSWVFDLNFGASFRLAAARDSIYRMAETLPKTPDVMRAVEAANDYLRERAASG